MGKLKPVYLTLFRGDWGLYNNLIVSIVYQMLIDEEGYCKAEGVGTWPDDPVGA